MTVVNEWSRIVLNSLETRPLWACFFGIIKRKGGVEMAVIKRKKPVVLTGHSAATFLKSKLVNEEKIQKRIELCKKK